MSAIAPVPPPDGPSKPARSGWLVPLHRLALWGLFLAFLYLVRDFFLTAFLTFLFCYLTLAVVGRAMKRLSPDRERPWLRRLLTVAVFVLVPLLLLAASALVGPRLLEQGQHLAGWAAQVTPETEVARLLEGWVGPAEFRQQYGRPDDPRYKEGLEAFRATGASHVQAYQDFPALEAWLEGGFARQFDAQQSAQVRMRLLREGTSSEEFGRWFQTDKVPELQAQARREVPAKGRPPASVDPLVAAAAHQTPAQLLEQARRNPAGIAALRQEWMQDTLKSETARARKSPAYQEQFRTYYERKEAKAPLRIPYSFDEYLALQKVRPGGARAFGDALEKMMPTAQGDSEQRLRADFEAARKHELFRQWWGSSSVAGFIRHYFEGGLSNSRAEQFERYLSSLINIPLEVGTALLLSLFICIDFPNLKQGVRKLRQTWLQGAYDELAPAFANLGELIGRALNAQGMISLCNSVMMFVAMSLLGVEHAILLSVAVFILCLVPTLGLLIAWVLIAAVALVQPGGGVTLALEVSGAVLVVSLVETFVLSPRILGRMMELHPVLIVALLPVAQYFFGVWGLILATPVAVYVIYVLILGRGLPGHKVDPPQEESPPDTVRTAAPARDGLPVQAP
jgi:predicted PurR-regulated permease PerM